jgi:GNAT superfamily N-acetyltransferase
MVPQVTDGQIVIREFTETDIPQVLDLLNRCFPTRHTVDWWLWKYQKNVFGKSIILVAEVEKRIVGLRGFWRWDLLYKGDILKAVQSVDTCVDAAYRRRGIFTELVEEALRIAKSQGIQLVYNFPGSQSLPGYMKLGWHYVKRGGWYIRPLRPLRVLREYVRGLDGRIQSLVLEFPVGDRSIDLVHASTFVSRIGTHVSGPFLRWRYAQNPMCQYGMTEPTGNPGQNTGIFRINKRGGLRELCLVDIVNYNEGTVGSLVKHAIAAAKSHGADFILMPELGFSGTGTSMLRHGFVLTRSRGFNFVCKALDATIDDFIYDYANWFVTPGNTDTY